VTTSIPAIQSSCREFICNHSKQPPFKGQATRPCRHGGHPCNIHAFMQSMMPDSADTLTQHCTLRQTALAKLVLEQGIPSWITTLRCCKTHHCLHKPLAVKGRCMHWGGQESTVLQTWTLYHAGGCSISIGPHVNAGKGEAVSGPIYDGLASTE